MNSDGTFLLNIKNLPKFIQNDVYWVFSEIPYLEIVADKFLCDAFNLD